VLVQEGPHLAFGQRAGELVDHLSTDQQEHMRDAAQLQRLRHTRAFVGIELGQHELPP
jgi:hypothetical protein